MIEALKPCPFCGHKTPEFERMGTSRQSCIVVCGNCGCRHESSDEGDRCGQSWNERAAIDAALAQADAPSVKESLTVAPGECEAFEAWWGRKGRAFYLSSDYTGKALARLAFQARAASAPAAPGWQPIDSEGGKS